MNRYGRLYYRLITNAQSKNRTKKDAYYESHHILPRSLGGTNRKDNLVLLTAREHYIAHLILVRCVEPNLVYKMVAALARFRKQAQNSRNYNLFRNTIIQFSKGELNKSYGKIWIHNTETLEIRYVLKDELNDLPSIWTKGLPYQRGGYRDRTWLHLGNQRCAVPHDQVNELLKQGWTLGRNVKLSDDHYRKMASARNTVEKNQKHGQNLTGRIAIRNIDGTIKRVQQDQLETYLSQGWSLHKGSGTKMVTSAGRPCVIDGVTYNSVADAATKLSVSYGHVYRRIKNSSFTTWNFAPVPLV